MVVSHHLPRAALLLSLVVTACRTQQSFMVVTAESADPTPISGVVELDVTVVNGDSSTVLSYAVPLEQSPLTITGTLDPVTGKIGTTLSVSFTLSHTDAVTIDVAARDASKCTVGHGTTTTMIKKGGVGQVIVALDHTIGPCDSQDGSHDGAGGGADDGGGVVFPGCDPAELTCGAGLTCAVNCMALEGQCVLAGNEASGSLCQFNSDCQPGTQCFSYAPGCDVRSCLKFCKTDSDCGPSGSGSLCQGKVPCTIDGASVLTAYHTCTFGCDPRGPATTGCPTGLHCFVVDTMDQVDCACTEATRTHLEGQACTRGVDCAPGLICLQSSGRCQKVCKLSDNGADCASGQVCSALQSDQIYGTCAN
jgi:hypothetical protein